MTSETSFDPEIIFIVQNDKAGYTLCVFLAWVLGFSGFGVIFLSLTLVMKKFLQPGK